ncbi:winged helix-turn-helix domain-containing protein [Spirochaeta africana]|nr:winged helix-turn-helix domain-containing protein [Spirochaeta africana]
MVPAGMDLPVFFRAVLRYGSADSMAQAIEMGMDDFVRLPCSPVELEYRIQRCLGNPVGRPQPDSCSGLARRDRIVLDILQDQVNQPVSRAVLQEIIGGSPESRCLDMCISRLRRRLQQNGSGVSIRSVRGIGYMLEGAAGIRI